jgi:hypothetical protein
MNSDLPLFAASGLVAAAIPAAQALGVTPIDVTLPGAILVLGWAIGRWKPTIRIELMKETENNAKTN